MPRYAVDPTHHILQLPNQVPIPHSKHTVLLGLETVLWLRVAFTAFVFLFAAFVPAVPNSIGGRRSWGWLGKGCCTCYSPLTRMVPQSPADPTFYPHIYSCHEQHPHIP